MQVDLIDMQSQRDGEYRFIMNYQDHLTKFVCLRPLKSKTAEEVAYHLVDIFCDKGAPHILQSDNGREFSNKVCSIAFSFICFGSNERERESEEGDWYWDCFQSGISEQQFTVYNGSLVFICTFRWRCC